MLNPVISAQDLQVEQLNRTSYVLQGNPKLPPGQATVGASMVTNIG